MIERFVDLANIRTCAESNGQQWEAICQAADNGREIDVAMGAGIVQSLVAAGVNALPLLIQETIDGMAAKLPRSTYHPAMQAIRHEFGLLAKGEINPSLYMHPLAVTMAEARGIAPQPVACYYLPVVPVLPGEGDGGEAFYAATKSHLANFNAAMVRFLKGDESALDDIRVSLTAIEARRPIAPYFTPISFGAAFVAALVDKALPLSQENKMLFSRIGAVVKIAMNEAPLKDNSICSRLAYALAHSTGEQKRVELLRSRLALDSLLSTEPPRITEFPPADVFVAAFTEAADAWKVYMERGVGKQELTQTVDMLRLISGNNAGLKKLADAFKKLTGAVMKRRYDEAKELFDHVTQFVARYFDAVDTRDAAVVERVAAEEWAAAEDIENFGVTSAVRDADVSAYVDVVREAAIDVRAAMEAFEKNELLRLTENLEMVRTALKVIGLIPASQAVDSLLNHINHHPEPQEHHGIHLAIDCMARYLDIIYVRPDDAPLLLTDISERYLKLQRKPASVESAVDRDMFEVFREEANEVVDVILATVPDTAPIKKSADATVVRRGFHTLKGSAGMVGLDLLAGLMAQVEKTFNEALVSDPPYSEALSDLAREAATFARAICQEIEAKGQAEFEPEAVVAKLKRVSVGV